MRNRGKWILDGLRPSRVEACLAVQLYLMLALESASVVFKNLSISTLADSCASCERLLNLEIWRDAPPASPQ